MSHDAAPRRTSDELREALADLPSSRASAIRILHVADDPDASVAQLGEAVAVDPVLTAQVMRLANSAYYGLSRRVTSAEFAVSVLGFATIRSLAAASAAGAFDGEDAVPAGFWEHAARSAVGVAHVGVRLQLSRPEAFSLGLLHDIGDALLHRLDPEGYTSVWARTVPTSRARIGVEREELGIDHAEAGAIALESWRFPAEMCVAIATHHDRLPANPGSHQRALAGGHVLARLAELDDGDVDEAETIIGRFSGELRCAQVDPAAAFAVSRLVAAEATAVAATFSAGGSAAA